jgi:hypothetical protein
MEAHRNEYMQWMYKHAMWLYKDTYCGVPSKKPDYLNQGVRPLLRND